jgi:hypothetical protein
MVAGWSLTVMVFVAFDWKAARAAVMAVRTAGSVRLGMVGGVVEGTLIRKVLGPFKDRKKKVDCKTYEL